MDLLNLHQPWDCQRFPKSKTICYGGGGSVGNLGKVVEPSLKGLDLTKSTGALSPKGVKKITSSLKAAGDGSAYTNAVNEMNKKIDAELRSSKKGGGLFGSGISISPPKINIPKSTQDLVKGASTTIESVKKDVAQSDIGKATSAGIENVKKEGTKATNQIKQEANKLAKGDFSLKKAVQGTASGAAETFKKSDVGKVVKKIAKETGYTGSDFDKGMQKIEKEASNVVNQTLDFIDSPEKVIKKGVKRASDFVETVKGDLTDTANAYSGALQSIGEAGENIGKAATDTFQTGMNAASALGQNLANQLGTASGDKGGLKGQSRSNLSELLEQKRKGRRGGLSRSGTSRTLITGKV